MTAFLRYIDISTSLKVSKGPSIKYVSTFLAIFNPPSPHVSNCQHLDPPIKKDVSIFEFYPHPLPKKEYL